MKGGAGFPSGSPGKEMKEARRIKRIRKILSFLTVICCLTGCLRTVSAASDAGSGGRRAGATVVFENEEHQIPLLSVTKKVTPKGAAPRDDVFTFTLKMKEGEGKEWESTAGKTYKVYDAEGNPVKQLVNGYEQDYFTISNLSTFTLKDGQTAEFDFLPVGSLYKIEEQKKVGYTLKSITGGGTGTMPLGRKEVVAENSYAVKLNHLEVGKQVLFVEGYEAPASPVFEYRLELPGEEPGKTYSYVIYKETDGNRIKVGEGMTDVSGRFTLQGGQIAVFEDLSQDAVYNVTELGLAQESADREETDWPEGGWWLAEGSDFRQGTVAEAEQEIFKNTNTSFAVSKRLADYSELPEGLEGEELEKALEKMTFTFLLTDGDSGLGGVKYYLYHSLDSYSDKRGTRYDDEIHETSENGYFTLLPGQTAVFMGMKPGSLYKVSEVAALNPYYRQTSPASLDGFETRKVDNSFQELQFVNEPAPAGLRVIKSVENHKGEQPPDTKTEFRFILEEKKEGEADFSPMANKAYKIDQESLSTDGEGGFTLRDNQEALFEQLSVGATYRVREVLDPESYNTVEYELKEMTVTISSETEEENESFTITGEELSQILAGEAGEAGSTVGTDGEETGSPAGAGSAGAGGNAGDIWPVLAAGKSLTFAFTNSYVPDKLDLKLVKVDADGNPLSGAEFKLYRGSTEGSDNVVINPETGGDIFTSGSDGVVTITNLKAGTYLLQEVKAPSGYVHLANPIEIQIARRGSQVEVTLDGETFRGEALLAAEGARTGNEDVPRVSVELKQDGNDLVTLTVCNGKIYNLPQAGGIGIYWYSIGGMLLMMAAALILYKYKFAGEVGKD